MTLPRQSARTLLSLLLATAFASSPWSLGAEVPATMPTSQAATSPVAKVNTPSTSTAPTVAHRPTPAELIEKMRTLQKEVDALPKVAVIEIDSPVVEKPAEFSLFGNSGGTSLFSLLERLRSARESKDVRALLIILSPDAGMGFTQAAELRNALTLFRKAGKRVFVYADSYDTVSYTLASGASDIILLEGGELFMPGIGLENQFYKGLMDKVGVKGDYVQIGEYKGAEEPYTRSAPSEELRGEMNKLADGLYAEITAGLARGRNLPLATVQQAVDEAMVPAQSAKDRKLVDHLSDRDSLRQLVADELNTKKINVINDYGGNTKPEIDFSNPFGTLALLAKKAEPTSRETVAIVYAEGTIVDGAGGGGGGLPIPGMGSGPSIGSEDIRRAMKAVRDDDNIKAIVLRIDSPGGSALASEVMWQAVRKAAMEKPVIISVGSMAASGGYYLASAGDHIVADPSAIVGSIGVVGGKFVTKGLFDKLGITAESYTKGRNADLYSSNTEWTDRQRRQVNNWMRTTYEQFTDRVMTTRRGKIVDIDKVARGRVFVAADALKLGMVDELGGLTQALHLAASRAELDDGKYDIRVYPESRPLQSLFGGLATGNASGAPSASLTESSVLKLLTPGQRQGLMQQLQFLQLLQQRPVILAAPFTVTIR